MSRTARTSVPLLLALAACTSPLGSEERVAPLTLAPSAHRVVLTPGGRALVRVAIERDAADDHPVLLDLAGSGPGVQVVLSETTTRERVVTLAVSADGTASAQESTFVLHGRLGLYEDSEPLAVSVQIPDPPVSSGPEEYAPGVVGEPKTLRIDGQDVSVEVIDGLAILAGDIVLGDILELEAATTQRTGTCNPSFHTDFACAAWTDGVIGYSIANDWGDANNAEMNRRIRVAIDAWEQNTGMRFVPRTSGETLQFRSGSGCSSGVGRVVFTGFDVQSIKIGMGCDDFRVAHEIGHAIGLYHEQMRNDRNSFVTVDFGRIELDKIGQFFQIGDFLVDRGAYDYDSVMHYSASAFAINAGDCETGMRSVPQDLSQCSIRTRDPADIFRIGQRDHLSEGDILGAYSLYPPQYTIRGASPGAVGDHFSLFLQYTTPIPRPDRIVWTTDRSPAPLGTGHSLSFRASDVPQGINVITASFIVAGITVVSQSITLVVANDAPQVALTITNGRTEQDLNHIFTVAASVSDVQNGGCPPSVCRWTWTPTPVQLTDTTANFNPRTTGPLTITLRVEDPGGAIGTASVTVEVVNSPPVAEILQPSSPIAVPDGFTVQLVGRGTDFNTGPVDCALLLWRSSVATDVLGPPSGCSRPITVHGVGVHTISLKAFDPAGLASAIVTVDITVAECTDTNCAPIAFFSISPPSITSPVPVYFIENPIAFELSLSDIELDNPVSYRLLAERTGEPTVTIATGSVTATSGTEPVTVPVTWTPEANIPDWFLCSQPSEYRGYTIVLEATDNLGATTRFPLPVTLGCDFI